RDPLVTGVQTCALPIFDATPAVKPKDVEGLVVGSVLPERTAFQSHISSMAAEALGIRPSVLSARTEHMCASGTVGIRYAYAFIAAGLADLVMVLGVEKLNAPTGEEAILNMGTGVDREWEAAFGLTAPPCFALAAQRHIAAYGTTEEQLAMVGVKNHTHAAKNPTAHFQKGDARSGPLLADDLDAPPPLHVLADHRRRRRGAGRLRGSGARPHGQARVDPRHRPGARRVPADFTPRGLRPLAGARARRAGGVPDGRRHGRRRGRRRGS